MRCSKCDTELPDNALFCDQCGTPVFNGFAHTATADISFDATASAEAAEYPRPFADVGTTGPLDPFADVGTTGPLDPFADVGTAGPLHLFTEAETTGKLEPIAGDSAMASASSPLHDDRVNSADSFASTDSGAAVAGTDPDVTVAFDPIGDYELPAIYVPEETPMVYLPSPPLEPKLSRNIIISITAIAMAVAILILIGGWLIVRALLV